MLLAIAVTLIFIFVLLIGILMVGIKVNIQNDNTNDFTNYNEDFIVLGDVYIQAIHIQSIFVNKNDKSIEIKTDTNRYFYRYIDADEFNEALDQFDGVLNTKMYNNDDI